VRLLDAGLDFDSNIELQIEMLALREGQNGLRRCVESIGNFFLWLFAVAGGNSSC